MDYLLYHRGSFLSARLLATLLGLKATSNPDKIKNGKVVIRYGNSYGNFENDTLLNSPEIISLCSNSIKFSQWCFENGFNSPKYELYDKNKEYSTPYLLRKKYHKQGDDIILVDKPNIVETIESLENRFYVPFIETDSELGIHLVNKKVVKVFKKVPINDTSGFIRNAKRGYHFKIVNDIENNYKVAQELCENLFEKLGLNFGRVDIAYNIDNKKYTIWEVNTAPGLNRLTSEVYSTLLREIICSTNL
jgi:glutathione synthase/RimK-type ligase-like ATP-grasp enzyme